MEVLKIRAYQLFANYRKPMSYNFIDTYPLPPLSTVKGWFHNVIEAKEYIPVSMSIQEAKPAKDDEYSSIVHDMQTMIKFDRKRNGENQIIVEGFNKAFSQSPKYVATIHNIALNIYLASDKESLKKFKQRVFEKDFPSLGRYEDLLRIDQIEFIDLSKKEINQMEPYTMDYKTYINRETADNLNIIGTNYLMNFKYELIDGLRYFTEKLPVVFINSDNEILERTFLFDDKDGRIVDLIGDYK
jgi:CRISPR-associated protein Cas5t